MKPTPCAVALLVVAASAWTSFAWGQAAWAQSVRTQPRMVRAPARPQLDKADQQLLLEATERLNDHNPIMIGTQESWKSDTSSGTVHLDRIFHTGKRDCHAVTYSITAHPAGTTKPRRRTYHATWCRSGDGSWREG